jgi:hypothetical protein
VGLALVVVQVGVLVRALALDWVEGKEKVLQVELMPLSSIFTSEFSFLRSTCFRLFFLELGTFHHSSVPTIGTACLPRKPVACNRENQPLEALIQKGFGKQFPFHLTIIIFGSSQLSSRLKRWILLTIALGQT